MKNKSVVFFITIGILLLFGLLYLKNISLKTIVVGTSNPGKIIYFSSDGINTKKIKEIATGYNFVYTVKVGNVKNDGRNYTIAGVSDSFYGKKIGCKIVGYSDIGESFEIDRLDDFRCKDITIGDANNDHKNDIVMGTHGEGIIRLYQWNGSSWNKEDIESNYISRYDKSFSKNHRVPNSQLPCAQCVIQSAVHIVKVIDTDKNGINEVWTTISSPLELQDKTIPEITFLVKYTNKDGKWMREIIDTLQGREFRGLAYGDIFHDGNTGIVVGIGSGRTERGSVFAYRFEEGKWKRHIVYDDPQNTNLKNIDVTDIDFNRKDAILISTGFPKSKTLIARWNGNSFTSETIADISDHLPLKGAAYNAMVVQKLPSLITPFIVSAGFVTFPEQKIGAEATNTGFLTIFRKVQSKWEGQIIVRNSIWAMDIY